MPITLNGTTGIQNVLGSASAPADTNTTTPTTGVYYPSATTWGVSTAGTNALYIDASQNVGIGTTSPSYKLEVQGSANTYLGQRIYNTNSGSSAVSYLQIGNDSNGATAQLGLNSSTNTTNFGGANGLYLSNGLSAPIAFATAGGERMRITSSGNVAIGSTVAGNVLTVSGSSGYRAQEGSGTYYYDFGRDSASGYFLINGNQSGTVAYVWQSAAAERMRIDTSGNLLVGTTSTTSVNAGIAIIPNGSSGTTGYVRIGHSSATSGQGYLDFLYNNSIIGSVQQAGTTGVSFNTSSDYRLKENVTPITTGLAKISALKPVTYDWISDKSAGEGFIAHELAEVIPLAVSGAKDAVDEGGKPIHQGVDYSKIVVHLVAAIQELKAEFDAYKAAHP